MERHRKDAKALAKAFRAGDPEAIARAEDVLGARAHERFLLSDAQHVVAVEHGYRTWPELKQAELDEVVDTGLEYRLGDPVRVRIVRHGGRVSVTDDGAAVERAGRPDGWRDVARRIDDGLVVNVSRQGVVSLPVVGAGPGLESIVRRIGEASLALYQDLLELDG